MNLENVSYKSLSKEIETFKKKYKKKYINRETYEILSKRKHKHEKDLREEFQRDRDRIIHSRAFRRLSGKTQVFNSNKGDHYRTRLTHSLEVSQIGRTIGKTLDLNEDLIEAIALGHDLGHTPFGHVIERTLHDILRNREIEEIDIFIQGGFKHNFQSLHVVDNIEMGHRNERGLNLTLAVRDGIIKHTGRKIRSSKTNKKEEVEYEVLNLSLKDIKLMDYQHAVTLEGQIVALADEIAQSTHDLEDSVRSGIIHISDLKNELLNSLDKIFKNNDLKNGDFDYNQFKLLNDTFKIWANNDSLNGKNTTANTNILINLLINYFVRDAIKTTMYNIHKASYVIDSNGLVDSLFVDNSKYVKKFRENISKYIYEKVVSSQEVAQSDSKAKYLIKQIFKAYYEDPRQLPDYALKRYYEKRGKTLDRIAVTEDRKKLQNDSEFIRIICDHIAGMTDSFAMEEYNNLYGVDYTL